MRRDPIPQPAERDARWNEVKELLADALDLPVDERPAFLGALRRREPELAGEVAGLLEIVATDAHRLERPAMERLGFDQTMTPPEKPPERVGPWRLESKLGEGGMGSVWRARRDDGAFERTVAVKLVRPELASDLLRRRFVAERRILASLDHPGIAGLLDAGATDDGAPYLVLELVDGEPIDRWCDARAAPIEKRLVLFLDVCSAVAYAHGRLVLHRDIKPTNVLVGADGAPKLLDFGIAKLLDPTADEDPQLSSLGLSRPLTPECASPEQLRGDPLTTASDVYSLGVLLYRLLAGRPPYDAGRGESHEALARRIDAAPAHPLTAAARDRPPPGVDARALRGDLDAIAARAVASDAADRYGTVAELADDVRRHVAGRPIRARPPSLLGRGIRFARRHRVGVSLGLAAVTLVLASAASALVSARRAERRFRDVRQLANTLVFDVHDAIVSLPGATDARRLIVQKALAYLDGLSAEARSDATLQQELAAAYERIGDVQGRPRSPNLGESDAAIVSYRKALAIREGLARGSGDAAVRRQLAATHAKIGEILASKGDFASAQASLRSGLALAEGVADDPVVGIDARRDEALILTNLGYAQEDAGDRDAALESHRRSLRVSQDLVRDVPDDAEANRRLCVAYGNVGDLEAKQGRLEEGLRLQTASLEVARKLLARDPQSATAIRDVLVGHIKVGELQGETGNTTGSVESYERALEMAESLSAADPKNVLAQADVAFCSHRLGEALLLLKRGEQALAAHRRALAVRETLVAADPANAETRSSLAYSYRNVGRSYTALAVTAAPGAAPGLWREARRSFERSLEIWTAMRKQGTLPDAHLPLMEELRKQVAAANAHVGS